MIVELAHAKLNLTLEVIRKRADGYHDLESVIQTVDLHDVLEFSDQSDVITFQCSDATINDAENLVVKAAETLRQVSGCDRGAGILLKKHIPIASGLGGGSADAAATLRGLNRLWRLGLSETDLIDIAAGIGSDVPFLVRGGTGYVSGRGELLEALPTPDVGRIVIATPKSSLIDSQVNDSQGNNEIGGSRSYAIPPAKTAHMFAMLTPAAYTTGSLTRKLKARMVHGKDCHPAFMFNVFQSLAPHAFPGWKAVHDAFTRLGATDIVLSGAGPSMFAFAPSKEVATAWSLLLPTRAQCDAFAVNPTPRIEVEAMYAAQ